MQFREQQGNEAAVGEIAQVGRAIEIVQDGVRLQTHIRIDKPIEANRGRIEGIAVIICIGIEMRSF